MLNQMPVRVALLPRLHDALLRLLAALVFVATLGSSFGQASERVDPLPPARARTPHAHVGDVSHVPRAAVVLVTLDGVRWQDIFGSAAPVPSLRWLMNVEGAAIGAPDTGATISASGPNFVSLPGYMELLTGRNDSACLNNDCSNVPFPTLADEVRADDHGEAAVFSSWSGIERAASAAAADVAVSAGRYGGRGRAKLEHDVTIAEQLRAAEHAPSELDADDFRPDQATGEVALAYLRTHHPDFMFVSLGETDEYAHQGNHAAYFEALRRDDAIIGELARLVLERNANGVPTTLIITTDHGRARSFAPHGGKYPESARVWLVAAGAGIEARGYVAAPKPRHLADVAPTIRALLQLPLAAPVAGSGEPLRELFSVHGS